MMWRGWCFAASLPLASLGFVASTDDASLAAFVSWVLGAAAAWTLLASLLARREADPLARGRRLAQSASSGLAALPVFLGVRLGLEQAAPWLLAACSVAFFATFVVRWRASVSSPGRRVAVACAWWFAGGLAVLAALGPGATGLAAEPGAIERRASAILDFDAAVPTRSLPGCTQRSASSELLLDRGAHPRLGPDTSLWFDALPASESEPRLRQIHRLALDTGAVECLTCGQPGNNQRPAVTDSGLVVIFDSDREATWRTPRNTELYQLAARPRRLRRARRLTYSVGPDDHAVLGPSSKVVIWSRGLGGRRAAVSSTIASGHGGVLLTRPGVVWGAADWTAPHSWTAPLGWSPDARTLVLAAGHPRALLDATGFDLATGLERTLARGLVPGSTVGVNGDGGWLAVATSSDAANSGWLPALAAWWLDAPLPPPPAFRGTRLASGPADGELRAVALDDEIALWGEPTGVALSTNGLAAFVAQRRIVGERVEERIVAIELECIDSARARSSTVSR